ncbi:adenylate/guanylate cyclase domain-containing protein [Leeuwenhoekiella aequorea]|uniref:Adenylate cyclase n=1 Tax=Leeuwenhoekiella aequorea TaxID=283736 RepID=A0A4Q0P7P6_9FLAO|nr:adenylate/guanylate cyclase domain-containing protein [Leeuwenhoekiella aequorea]RXG22501.1 adenylate cyclase [Leeuwenhoekiella aequorea]
MNKKALLEDILFVVFLILVACAFIYSRFAGLEDLVIHPSHIIPFDKEYYYLKTSCVALFQGLAILGFEKIVSRKLPSLSIWKKRIFWIIGVSALTLLNIIIVNITYDILFTEYTFTEALDVVVTLFQTDLFLLFTIYLFSFSAILSFLKHLRELFGQPVLLNYITGKYETPIEEYRVFMFLDLNNSTQLAEELGHLKYSSLLNNCFRDILKGLQQIDIEIYQFVGDEIVFTWKSKNDLNNKAFKIFEIVEKHFYHSKREYLKHFNVIPKFKAAVHMGAVSATIIGGQNYKEMAYHGDVLNTTSRLLEHCHIHKKNIVVSETYIKNQRTSIESIEYLGSVQLRGKQSSLNIYGM